MWCHVRNSVSSSDANGGPLSVDSDAGGAYCDMSTSRHMHRDWALLEDTLYTKGYLLKGIVDFKILMTFVGHVICCNVLPRAIRYVCR